MIGSGSGSSPPDADATSGSTADPQQDCQPDAACKILPAATNSLLTTPPTLPQNQFPTEKNQGLQQEFFINDVMRTHDMGRTSPQAVKGYPPRVVRQ